MQKVHEAFCFFGNSAKTPTFLINLDCTDHKATLPLQLVVDVGCGTGQAVKGLAPYATQIIGTDPSQGQIDQAKAAITLPNVQFKVSRAEVLEGITDHSVDLLTAAQCIHWFDFPAFFTEARRVLKPGGILAYWGYNYSLFEGDNANELNAIFKDLYANKLDAYWPSSRKFVERSYADIPAAGMANETRLNVDMKYSMTLDHFMGYLDTWSAIKEYQRAHPTDPILSRFKEQYAYASTLDLW